MPYNKNNKYQTKHNKNRYYNAMSYPNITIMSINNTETKGKDIIKKCNKKLSMLSLHDNSPNNKSLSNNTKHENKILKVNKQLIYMNRMMHIVNLYKKQQQDKQKVLNSPNGTFSIANYARDDDHDKHIRINALFNGYYKTGCSKNKIKPNKNFNQETFSHGVFYYNDFYFKKNLQIILLKNGSIINLLIICLA